MSKTRGISAYLLLLLVFGAGIWAILHFGAEHEAAYYAANAANAAESGAEAAPKAAKPASKDLAVLLLQLIAVVGAAAACGALFRRLGQPAVIGEMAAGIILGPSLLGWAWPAGSEFLFPKDSLGNLSLLSKVGILLFMFGVGMDLDLRSLRKHAQTALFVSHASIVVPFFLGVTSALLIHRTYAPGGVHFLPFALFMGIAMSITAFPVLARIIEERGLSGTALGTTAMASAAVDDVTAWTVLALVIAIARSQSPLSALWVAGMAFAFTAAMLYLVRPALARWMARQGNPSQPSRLVAGLLLMGVFASSLATETIGIHSLFGAFLAGAVMPDQAGLRAFLKDRLEYSASLYLLPIFFAFTGLRTEMNLLSGSRDWLMFALLMALAIAGKLGGGCLAARFTGNSWRTSLALGSLMNTRGLMELIVLNIGLDLGILSPRVFTMMVLMALATTAMTGPFLSLLRIGRSMSKVKSF